MQCFKNQFYTSEGQENMKFTFKRSSRYGYRGVICTSLVLGSASVICIAIITKHYNIHPLAMSMYKAPR